MAAGDLPPSPDQDSSVAEYVAVMARQDRGAARGGSGERLRAMARMRLQQSGWSFWMKLKKSGRLELRYKAPTGRSYNSLHTACQAFINSSSNGSTTPSRSNKRRRSSKDEDDTLITKQTCTATGAIIRKKMKKTCQVVVLPADDATTVRRQKKIRNNNHRGSDAQMQPQQRRARTLLSLLIDEGILVPRDKVVTYYYSRDNKADQQFDGMITGDGAIRCACCNKAFTVPEFEAHHSAASTSSSSSRSWGSRVFLKNRKQGRPTMPLSRCLVELMRRRRPVPVPATGTPVLLRPRLKERCSDPDGDSVCSVCNDGGELLLCEHCPSTFHPDCVGLQAIPEGDWFCPACRCGVCGHSDFHPAIPAADGCSSITSSSRSIVYCQQCERQYHVGCVAGMPPAAGAQEWLCSPGCEEVFRHLQGLAAGQPIPTSMDGVSLTILRRRPALADDDDDDDETTIAEAAEAHGKLCAALDVLHDCFETLVEPRTQSDLSADMVFSRESELRRLDFRGFYVVGLEKGGELVTVGTLRVHGTRLAEMPLVGTRFAHRRQGLCRLLVAELRRLLMGLGVRSLLLPATPHLLPMWTHPSMGFRPMTPSEIQTEAAEHKHTLVCFHGTTMCHKPLLSPALNLTTSSDT